MEDEMMDFEYEMNEEELKARIKDKLARKNFEAVVSGDIDFSEYHGTSQQKAISETLDSMIEHFEETEEYEKCALIQKALNKLNGNIKTV